MKRKLLTIGHSYVVALNRRLADHMARCNSDEWDVTAVAPECMHGDLRKIHLETLDNEACKLVPLPMRFCSKPHFMSFVGLQQVMKSAAWDVVHIWQEPFTIAGWQCARLAPKNSKVVISTFQNIAKKYPLPFRWMERSVLNRCNGWIAFGESIQQVLCERSVYREIPHRVIPVGVDTTKFFPDTVSRRHSLKQFGWSDNDAPVIGFLGRFIPEKGLRLMMRVLDSIEMPWRALFVGGGPMERELREWANKHSSQVQIVTGVAHDEVPKYLNAMDMLLAPSQTSKAWREQFGRMLLEAFSCGIPVIGSDSGEIPNVIANVGRVVSESNVQDWKSVIEELLAKPDLRLKIASLSRIEAVKRFDWSVIASSHLDFFGTLIR